LVLEPKKEEGQQGGPSVARKSPLSPQKLLSSTSRFGGDFLWPKDKEPPFPESVEEVGGENTAFCVIQIDFSDVTSSIPEQEISSNEGPWILPRSGILQFLIDTADDESMYGKKHGNIHHNENGYYLAFHPAMEEDKFDILSPPLDQSINDMDLPFNTLDVIGLEDRLLSPSGVPIKFTYERNIPPHELDKRLRNIVGETQMKWIEEASSIMNENDTGGRKKKLKKVSSVDFDESYEKILDEIRKEWDQLLSQSCCWLEGHPTFQQDDIRPNTKNYESLLSFSTTATDSIFMFGDGGDAGLLLPKGDGQNLSDLSKCIYFWDTG